MAIPACDEARSEAGRTSRRRPPRGCSRQPPRNPEVSDTSIAPVPELHELTIAEAIASGRPSVIAFATPLFCQTRFCGPVVEQIVVPVWERYGDRVNVLQVEPYEVPAARAGTLVPVETMIEWRLQTEPWIFVVDADGLVVAKFEGIMGLDEVNEAVESAFRAAP